MAQQKESVVTPERLAQGVNYQQWIESIERNQERFKENFEGTHLSDDDTRAFRQLAARPNGPAKCLALGEAWCPDVFRGLPVMAHMAHAGLMGPRIFFLLVYKHIMEQFLTHREAGTRRPVALPTRHHRYIAHWIERPALANEQMSELQKLTAPLRNPDISQEERQKLIQAYVDFQNGPIWAGWRDATVREIRELLEQHSG